MFFSTYVAVLAYIFRKLSPPRLNRDEPAYFLDVHIYGKSVCKIQLTSLQVSSARRKDAYEKLSHQELINGCRLGTDSHAEVTCYGRHARITDVHEGMTVNVSPFHDSYSPLTNVNFADACFAYDAPDGKLYILHHHYGLDFTKSMEDSILCTNQSRAAGLVVDDIPQCFDARGDSTHSIYLPSQDIRLPLSLHNAVSYLPVRYPTDEDMENGIDVHLSDDFSWHPTMFRSNVGVSSVSQFLDDLERDGCDENEVHPSLVEVVHPNLSDLLNAPIKISAVKHDVKLDMDAEKLADLWFISI